MFSGAVVGDLERVRAEDFECLVERLFVYLRVRVAASTAGAGLATLRCLGRCGRSRCGGSCRAASSQRRCSGRRGGRLAESRRGLAVDVLLDHLGQIVVEQLENAAGIGRAHGQRRRRRPFLDVHGAVDSTARSIDVVGALFLDRGDGHDRNGLEVRTHVVRHLLGGNRVAEEAEAQTVPGAPFAVRFGGVERVRVEDGERRHFRHVERADRPIELNGEEHRRVALHFVLDGLHRHRVFGLDDANRFVDRRFLRAFAIRRMALEQANGLRIGQVVELLDDLAHVGE